MVGVLVNVAAVLAGSAIGLLFKKGLPQRLMEALMLGIGLCTVYIGVSGSLKGENTLILILSVAVGAIIGTLLDIDRRLNSLATKIETRFSRGGERVSVAEGFITASLLFCVGAMTLVGSLQAGLSGDNEMLYTKSMLDLISSAVLAASLGIGVPLSALFVLVFQGGIVLLSGLISPLLTDYAIAEITCAGSVLIIGLGLNILGITKLKVANYLPALLIPPFLCLFM